MINTSINHMTAANASFAQLLSLANACSCTGIELRNDLSSPLFDGLSAAAAGDACRARGLQVYAVAEVVAFNRFTDATLDQAQSLARQAKDCGAQGIVLIPANDGSAPALDERTAMLTNALSKLLPVLDKYDLTGFVEPLGFTASTLRYKSEAIDAIEALDATERFKLVHDTFHHYLAGETQCYATHTGMVHVSGVVDASLNSTQMQDNHRVLVDQHDKLGNVKQLKTLTSAGYSGPVSMESFAPQVHDLSDPVSALQDSFDFINSGLAAAVA
ncbi:MAG: TIM barrel protein [Pseudomonadota bacterium]